MAQGRDLRWLKRLRTIERRIGGTFALWADGWKAVIFLNGRVFDLDGMVRRGGDWLSATVAGDLVMMSVESGNYVTLSRIGKRVWELIESPMAVEALCGRLVREYKVEPDACRSDIEDFLREMVELKAIMIDEASPG